MSGRRQNQATEIAAGRVSWRIALFCLIAAASVAPVEAQAEPGKSGQLHQEVQAIRDEYGLVALGAVIATPEAGIVALAVSGDRVRGGGPVAPGDAWHIGSNTKMLTALAWGRLVETGVARWGMTLGEIFAEETLHPDWKTVTIEDLFAHRSGAAPNPSMLWMIGKGRNGDPVEDQRAELVASTLVEKPSGQRGEYVYSNLGYIIAGRALEKAAGTGETYEALMARLVLDQAPQGSATGFGFGPPPTGIEGHKTGLFGRKIPVGKGQDADNAPAFASAGTAHTPLRAHALLLLSFLDGPYALPKALRQKLMTPYPDAESDYALGWGVQTNGDGDTLYLHAGSNTMWLSQIVLMPDPGAVIIINSNQADNDANKAIRKLTGQLIDWVQNGDALR